MEKAISKSSKEREKIRAVYTKINQWQGKNKGAGVETRGELFAVLRSLHFIRRLRHQLLLRKSKVSEPTPALIKLGRLRLQAKKGGWIHAYYKNEVFFCFPKRCRQSWLEKAAPALGSYTLKNRHRLRSRSKNRGSRRLRLQFKLRLRNTGFWVR